MTHAVAPEASSLVREDLVRLEPPALLGASCPACGQLSFPLERYCPHCGAAGPERVALPTSGTVYSYTIARFSPPGYAGPVPYAIGIVELDGGIRVASTLLAEPLDSLAIGSEVRFRLLDVATDDGIVTSYAYEQEGR